MMLLPYTIYRPATRHLRRLLVLMVLLFCWAVAVPAVAQQVGEYHIKAVFLTNLTHFVTWPETQTTEDTPFVIGLLGPDPFESILDKAVAGETKNGRPLMVVRYHTIEDVDPSSCAILFLHATEIEQWERIRTALAAYPILTVADVSGFPERGGMVNLLKTGKKIQVEINHAAVRRAGLSMSSKLLSLARIVQ